MSDTDRPPGDGTGPGPATAVSPPTAGRHAATSASAPTRSSAANDPPTPTAGTDTFAALQATVASVVAAQPSTIRLAVAAVASGGHLLVEDHPGLGKTTLAKALAAALGLGFRRVQCTADLLPADVVGATVLGPEGTAPVFRPGPVFTNVLMADELNRASARAQSALLEAMEERQVTVDGQTHALPDTFFVLATQNPYDAAGTAPLPHGQRDRFILRISLGYPDRAQMAGLLDGADPAETVRSLAPATTPATFARLRQAVAGAHVAAPVRDYALDLAEATRAHALVAVGASPRAVRALLSVAAALSVAAGRPYVSPDDVQLAAGPVLAHRLLLRTADDHDGRAAAAVVEELVATTPVPLSRTAR